jgi:hypothetical protein
MLEQTRQRQYVIGEPGRKMKALIATTLAVLVLGACSWMRSPPPPAIVIDASIDKVALLYPRVELRAGLPDSVPNEAATTRFFVGEWGSPLVSRDPRWQDFRYVVPNPCQALPQGDNISVRYEIYDLQGTLIKEDAVLGSVATCP